MAPPDFPQPEHYRPLGTLLQSIKRGQRFHPLSVLDIRAGQVSEPMLHPAAHTSHQAGMDVYVQLQHIPLHLTSTQCFGMLRKVMYTGRRVSWGMHVC